ncbi:MAG: hypothetical protein ABJ056_14420 [Halioglobus sp.]
MRSTSPILKAARNALIGMSTVLFSVVALAEHHAESAEPEANVRAMSLTIEAVITAIDLETRQVTVEGPGGQPVTMTATEQVVKLEDVKVGETIKATYFTSLESELREPTAEELAEPWVVIADAAKSEGDEQPAIGGARMIRAVCTIEGLNRVLGTVTIMDPRGKLHLIGDVEPEKMEGVTLGQTVVMVYTEALAVTLEPIAK